MRDAPIAPASQACPPYGNSSTIGQDDPTLNEWRLSVADFPKFAYRKNDVERAGKVLKEMYSSEEADPLLGAWFARKPL